MHDDHKIEVRTALSVFEKITRLGHKDGDSWTLDQMSADTGFDGYSVTLRDRHATLTVNFHNTYTLDCANGRALEEFVAHLERINNSVYD